MVLGTVETARLVESETEDVLDYDVLKKYVPEIEENEEIVVREIYKKVRQVYDTEEDKILAYYYLGYIITATEDNLSSSEVEISNVSIKGTPEAIKSNPYLLKLKRLLDLKNNVKETLNSKVKIATF